MNLFYEQVIMSYPDNGVNGVVSKMVQNRKKGKLHAVGTAVPCDLVEKE